MLEVVYDIPQIGLGTYALNEKSILTGLNNGYRLLDTAWQYGNESEIGRAIKMSGIPREEVFITTKLWTEDIRNGDASIALNKSLKNIGVDYIDLFLIHWPTKGFEKAWEQMVRLQEDGKIKRIGVSNFNIHHFEELKHVSNVVPYINQIELHPNFQNKEVVDYCNLNGILVQAWCPLGGPYNNYFKNSILIGLSEKYKKSVAQIILRWHLQKKILSIPRSSDKKRQKENMDIFDFYLDEEDMCLIDSFDTGHRIGVDPDNFSF